MKEKMYSRREISEKFEIPYIKVAKRFVSKYAEKRWGVVVVKLPDGSIKRYVPTDKLHLWTQNINYVGKPVFK